MHTILGAFLFLAGLAAAFPDRPSALYSTPNQGGGGGMIFTNGGGGQTFGDGGSGAGVALGGGGGGSVGGGGGAGAGISLDAGCPAGQVMTSGGCVVPQITRNMFLYAAPAVQAPRTIPAQVNAQAKAHLNFVFIKVNGGSSSSKPLVVPPPKQKTLVYVLSKRPAAGQQQVIEVPATPTKPELFFVNYNDGDDTQLPGGVSLQQALAQSVQQGEVVQAGGGGGGASVGSVGSGSVGSVGSVGSIGVVGVGSVGSSGNRGGSVGGGYSLPSGGGSGVSNSYALPSSGSWN